MNQADDPATSGTPIFIDPDGWDFIGPNSIKAKPVDQVGPDQNGESPDPVTKSSAEDKGDSL